MGEDAVDVAANSEPNRNGAAPDREVDVVNDPGAAIFLDKPVFVVP